MRKVVFLDSDVWFAACSSLTGGSAYIFERATKDFTIIASKTILAEVEKNVREKLQSYHLERFFTLTGKAKIVSNLPSEALIKKASQVIIKKDAVILAEAKRIKCDYLLTLDKKHFLKNKVKSFLKPSKILTPGDFIEEFYKND